MSRTGTVSTLYSFQGGTDGSFPTTILTKLGDKLYGATQQGGAGYGTVFSVTLTGREKVLHSFTNGADGGSPAAGLISVGDTLYGTTSDGGAGYGTVFSITPKGVFNTLHTFQGKAAGDGASPFAELVNVNGTLYGTTSAGGQVPCISTIGCGTVFSVTPRALKPSCFRSMVAMGITPRPDCSRSMVSYTARRVPVALQTVAPFLS